MVTCVRCGRRNEADRFTCYGCGGWLALPLQTTEPLAPVEAGEAPEPEPKVAPSSEAAAPREAG